MLAVSALTILTFVLRFSQIHQSLFGDEGFTYQDVVGRTLPQVVRNVHTGAENSPPLFFIFAWLTAKLGNPQVWIRLPSIVFGAATIPVLYLIGCRSVGRIPGLIAGLIMALSPFSLYYGVEARPYATMVFWLSVSTLALLLAVDTRDRRWWALYVVAAAAAAYSHYTCIFVLVVQGAWSLWACRDRLVETVVSHALVVVLYIPWLPHLRGKALAVIGFLEPLTAHNVIVDLMRPIAGYPYAPLSAIPTYVGFAVVAACAIVGLGERFRQAAAARNIARLDAWPRRFFLLAAMGLASPVLLLIYSETSTDLWVARNLYASVPAAALVLAALICAPRLELATLLVAAVVAVLALGLARAISPSWQRPPFRSVATYLDRTAAPRAPVAFASLTGGFGIPLDLHRPHRIVALAALARDVPANGRGYLVTDSKTGDKLGFSSPPQVAGLTLVRVTRFRTAIVAGLEVVTYRRAAAGA
ncbi:MAG TPA: glycosyltransferase family 39 protein [Solirubrobacteraceae bacterium]|nr:glycosyltransferase family 39 protein [Solirubrobacteraceae bacterium]